MNINTSTDDSTEWTNVEDSSDSLAYQKLEDLSSTFQDLQNVFPGLCHSPAMLNYRPTAVTYSVYTVWQYNLQIAKKLLG